MRHSLPRSFVTWTVSLIAGVLLAFCLTATALAAPATLRSIAPSEHSRLFAPETPAGPHAGPVTPANVPCWIKGTVRDASTLAAIPNIRVTFSHKVGSSFIQDASTTTNGSGFYQSPALAAGAGYYIEYRDYAGRPFGHYANRAWTTARDIFGGTVVTPDPETTVTCDAVLTPGWSLVVNLTTEATGSPAADVRVTFDDLTGGVYYSSLTDAFGHYTYMGNNPGPFRFGAGGGTSDFVERPWTTAWGARVVNASAPSTLSIDMRVRHKPAVYHDIVRLSGADRYKTSLAMAIEQDPGWAVVQDVVIASGEDAGMVDALSAAGLAGLYTECPLLLVRKASIPPDTLKALQAMPAIRVHVVGGTGAVNDAVYHQIQALPNVGMARMSRIAGANRYSTAAEVAKAMKAKLGGGMPTGGLIANGEPGRDPWDALAFSPVSQKNHFPVYLVTRDSVPASTSAAIASVGSTALYIGGGTGVVSDSVATALGVAPWNRLFGATRYDTAKAIADRAVGLAWLGKSRIGMASTLPDALSGGTMMGRKNGPLLLTAVSTMPVATRQFFTSALGGFENGFALGGAGAVSEAQRLSIQAQMNP